MKRHDLIMAAALAIAFLMLAACGVRGYPYLVSLPAPAGANGDPEAVGRGRDLFRKHTLHDVPQRGSEQVRPSDRRAESDTTRVETQGAQPSRSDAVDDVADADAPVPRPCARSCHKNYHQISQSARRERERPDARKAIPGKAGVNNTNYGAQT